METKFFFYQAKGFFSLILTNCWIQWKSNQQQLTGACVHVATSVVVLSPASIIPKDSLARTLSGDRWTCWLFSKGLRQLNWALTICIIMEMDVWKAILFDNAFTYIASLDLTVLSGYSFLFPFYFYSLVVYIKILRIAFLTYLCPLWIE